jgi:hypothetical protein
VEKRSWSRPTLARRPVFGQLAASPTSFPLEEPPRQVSASHEESPPRTRSLRLARQVSASHEESPPRTRSPAPTSAWVQTHGASIATDACGGTNLHVTQEQQLAAMHAAYPGKSLNADLTGCADITSPSSPTLPHARLSPRHSSTLYDTHKPRLRLGLGKLGKYSGNRDEPKLLGEEAKCPRVNSPTRPRGGSPRQGTTTCLQCNPTDSDI